MIIPDAMVKKGLLAMLGVSEEEYFAMGGREVGGQFEESMATVRTILTAAMSPPPPCPECGNEFESTFSTLHIWCCGECGAMETVNHDPAYSRRFTGLEQSRRLHARGVVACPSCGERLDERKCLDCGELYGAWWHDAAWENSQQDTEEKDA